jgi:hypothetical protein
MLIERRPFTLNKQYFLDYKEEYLSFYQSWSQRGQNDQPNHASTLDENAEIPTGSPQAGITGTNAADRTSDAMDPALNVMASVRAYLQGSKDHAFLLCLVPAYPKLTL